MHIYDEKCACGATGLIIRSERTSACWWGGRAGQPRDPPLVEEECRVERPRTCPVCGDRPAERDRARAWPRGRTARDTASPTSAGRDGT